MKSQVKICLKIAWLAATIAILLMGTNVCVSSGEACVQAGNTMLGLMSLVTFPAGIFFFLIAAIFVDPGSIHQSSDFITAWFVMMCGGLLQWFVMVPNLFERGFTTLNLEASATLASRDSQRVRSEPSREVIQSAPVLKATLFEKPPAPTQVVSKRTRSQRKSIKSTMAFDQSGRTPLERVIDHL